MVRKIDPPEEDWDIRKVAGTIVSFIILIVGVMYIKQTYFDPQNKVKGVQVQIDTTKDEVKSSSSSGAQNISYPNLQNEFQKKVEQVKDEVGNLSFTEVASSSPQIQKILNDIKSLQNYPGNKAREMCENICRSF